MWFVWLLLLFVLLLFVLLLFGSFDLIGIVMTPLDCVSGPSLARIYTIDCRNAEEGGVQTVERGV